MSVQEAFRTARNIRLIILYIVASSSVIFFSDDVPLNFSVLLLLLIPLLLIVVMREGDLEDFNLNWKLSTGSVLLFAGAILLFAGLSEYGVASLVVGVVLVFWGRKE